MKKLAIIFLYLFISNFSYADIITFEIGKKNYNIKKCPLSSITLEISQNTCILANYQWQKKSAFGVFLNITGATNITYQMTSKFIASESGTFRVLVYNKLGLCETSNEINILYIPPPTISIIYKNQGGQVDNSTLCTTDSVSWVVNKSGGSLPLTTTWSISNGSKSVIIKPVLDTVTIYGILNGNPKIQVSIKDSFGCLSSTSAAMLINGASLKSIDTLPATICEGSIIKLKAKLNNTPTGAFPFSFSWINSSASFTVNANPPPKDSLATLTAISADTTAVLLLKIYDENTNCVAYYNNKFKIQSAKKVDILQSIESSGNYNNDNIVCIGTTYDIDTIAKIGVNEFKNLKWQDGSTKFPRSFIQSDTFNQYFITATDPKGCNVLDTINIYGKANPIVSINNNEPNFTICLGQTQKLIASGANNYFWSTSEKVEEIVVNPINTTIFFVIGTNLSGCSATKSTQVVVNPLPKITITKNSEICQNTSITLKVTGGNQYLWENGNTDSLRTVAPLNSTIYKVTVTTLQGCSDDTLVLISVAPNFTITNFSPDITICPGSSAKIYANVSGSGYNYKWNTNETKDSISVTPTQTTTYTVTVYSSNGCTATKSITVTVGNNLNFSVPDVTICTGNSATLKVNINGSGFSYKWDNNATSDSIIVKPTITTTYTVTVTSSNGCSRTQKATVTVLSKLDANAGSDVHICNGKTITISASGGQNYQWSNGVNNQVVTITPATTTILVVTVTSGSCSATDSITIFVHDYPIANAGKDTTICSGSTINLIASGGDNYSWSNGIKTATNSITPSITTNYIVTVSNNFNCSSTDTVVVNVNPKPNLSLSKDTIICGGTTIQLVANGGNTYKWSTGEVTNSISVTPTVTTFYTVTVSNNNLCSVIGTVKVEIAGSLGNVSVTPDPTICIGIGVGLKVTGGSTYLWNTGAKTDSIFVNPTKDSTYTVTISSGNCKVVKKIFVKVTNKITANAGADKSICIGEQTTLNAIGGADYQWSTGQKSASINVNPTTSTTYIVTVSSGSNCKDTDSVLVKVNPLPIANAGKDIAICNGTSGTLVATGGLNYSWSTNENKAEISVSPIVKTTYTVTVTDLNNCKSTDQVEVSINPRPIVNKITGDTLIKCSSSKLLYIVDHQTTTAPFAYNWVISDPTVLNILKNGSKDAELNTLNKGTASLLVKVVDGNNCEGSKNLVIKVEELSNLKIDTIIHLELGHIFLYPENDLCFEWEFDNSDSNFANPKPAPCNLADGKTNNKLNYCDLNKNFNSNNKYRLKLYSKDSNGNCTPNNCTFYAIDIRSIDNDNSKITNSIQLYPNPNDGNLYLNFKGLSNSFFNVKVINEIGILCKNEQLIILENEETIKLDWRVLNDGLHFILLQDQYGKVYKIPFLKANE